MECQLKKSHNLKLYSGDFLRTSSLGGVLSDSSEGLLWKRRGQNIKGLLEKKRSGHADIKGSLTSRLRSSVGLCVWEGPEAGLPEVVP